MSIHQQAMTAQALRMGESPDYTNFRGNNTVPQNQSAPPAMQNTSQVLAATSPYAGQYGQPPAPQAQPTSSSFQGQKKSSPAMQNTSQVLAGQYGQPSAPQTAPQPMPTQGMFSSSGVMPPQSGLGFESNTKPAFLAENFRNFAEQGQALIQGMPRNPNGIVDPRNKNGPPRRTPNQPVSEPESHLQRAMAGNHEELDKRGVAGPQMQTSSPPPAGFYGQPLAPAMQNTSQVLNGQYGQPLAPQGMPQPMPTQGMPSGGLGSTAIGMQNKPQRTYRN
tara:strand:+ start:4368 stop:5198 length:831 start_codon:yes stop_codon:yes gene_type:complete